MGRFAMKGALKLQAGDEVGSRIKLGDKTTQLRVMRTE